jgi:hypothetical protein
MKIYPNVFLIGFIIVLKTAMLTLFVGSIWASIVITTNGQATLLLKFALYLFTIILGAALYVMRRGLIGKFYFIKGLPTGELKLFDIVTLTTEVISKGQIKGYSKSSEKSDREFVRLYFKDRNDITILSYYSDFGESETKLKNERIEFLGVEKFTTDIWGRHTDQKY